jgi:hypothetical protein
MKLKVNATTHKSPITPSELLSALHQIDQANCDLKTVISGKYLSFRLFIFISDYH